MKTIINPKKESWSSLCARPLIQEESLEKIVKEVFENVRINGDQALISYTEKFDKVNIENVTVNEAIFSTLEAQLPDSLKEAIDIAIKNVEIFHKSQIEMVREIETSKGVKCWRENRAIEKVGIYIPGGTAPLFSTVIMLAVPALIAGCTEIVLCTPPTQNGEINKVIQYTATKIGIKKIYRVGGIQAIGAMTFGTESIPKVDKIFGPGNQYVTAAKQFAQKFGLAIDMPAGPSEVLVIADNSANPVFVAADLLSQAEHGEDSQVVLVSTSQNLIEQTLEQIAIHVNDIPRKDVAVKALENSVIVVFDSLNQCVEFSNLYAPEHLIIATENPRLLAKDIVNAGSVFLGNFSCESAGDYASGTNHTLPTNGFARNYSGVSLDSFVKKITFQEISDSGLQIIGPSIEVMAAAEQLQAHKNAVSVRLNYLKYGNN